MKPDRPLIVSVLVLAAGLGLTFGYCDGTVALNAGYPLSAASFKLCVSTFGPAAIGGPILTLLGVLLLIWALLCAILGQIGLVGSSKEQDQRPLRLLE